MHSKNALVDVRIDESVVFGPIKEEIEPQTR